MSQPWAAIDIQRLIDSALDGFAEEVYGTGFDMLPVGRQKRILHGMRFYLRLKRTRVPVEFKVEAVKLPNFTCDQINRIIGGVIDKNAFKDWDVFPRPPK